MLVYPDCKQQCCLMRFVMPVLATGFRTSAAQQFVRTFLEGHNIRNGRVANVKKVKQLEFVLCACSFDLNASRRFWKVLAGPTAVVCK